MAISDAQKRATLKYLKDKTKQLAIRFYPADMELFEWLDAQDNKQGYIKQLIREDMERKKRD
ncbi:hypothetical protein KPC83_02985 [Collinsella sp. zg1085]|uniref:hypothetical protein n=1 Tax=Collinsella sp. zg1085 TaxID=2844380 RepID=UPI001C0ABE33|nr:hypothetical protein [Collinsella sp. zg1085]QWT18110.1 hypothetical protein KPC83_02985 [Collinsella sp. zg1085]